MRRLMFHISLDELEYFWGYSYCSVGVCPTFRVCRTGRCDEIQVIQNVDKTTQPATYMDLDARSVKTTCSHLHVSIFFFINCALYIITLSILSVAQSYYMPACAIVIYSSQWMPKLHISLQEAVV